MLQDIEEQRRRGQSVACAGTGEKCEMASEVGAEDEKGKWVAVPFLVISGHCPPPDQERASVAPCLDFHIIQAQGLSLCLHTATRASFIT